jgi:heat shock protein HspQ
MGDELPRSGAEVHHPRFAVGDCIHHVRFGYRGVVFDVDATFQGTDEWYEEVARSRPPRDAPWYHVLPDGADHTTYVAERNLEPDASGEPVSHPLVGELFDAFEDGRYLRTSGLN